MSNLIILRNLPFEVWHKPFNENGSKWKQGGIRDVCSCPYRKHRDPVFLDHQDPVHLKEMFSIESGSKLLIFSDLHKHSTVKLRIFETIEILWDAIRFRFEKVQLGLDYDMAWLGGVRWVSVLPSTCNAEIFEKEGGMNVFVEELCRIHDVPRETVLQKIEEIENIPVDPKIKISSKAFILEAKEKGIEVLCYS